MIRNSSFVGLTKEHYKDFSPFCKDDGYEKKDNKPVCMIYVSSFPEKEQMLLLFDTWAKEDGFDGIYIIETYTEDLSKSSIDNFNKSLTNQSKMIYLREPSVSTSIYQCRHPFKRLIAKIMREKEIPEVLRHVTQIDGRKLYDIMKESLGHEYFDLSIAHGLFFEWDNTPRHKKRGYVISAPLKEQVMEYLDLIREDEYIFINAWNEWAEGMMLEPTEDKGYTYLEWINEWSKIE